MSKIELSASLVVFDTFYKTRSVSSTSEILGISRSTVRSHFDRLAQMLSGGDAITRRGKITNEGERLYDRIRHDLAALSQNLDNIAVTSPRRGQFAWASQRHPIYLLDDKTQCVPIIYQAWQAWRSGNAGLESLAMRALVPWSLILRPWTEGWVLVEIGEKSSFATWFGAERARYFKSGLRQVDLTGDISFAETTRAYDEAARWGTPVLHHVQACIPRIKGADNQWISYQRLVLPIKWGDELGLAVFVARTNNIQIDGLSEQNRHLLEPDLLMEDEPTQLGTL